MIHISHKSFYMIIAGSMAAASIMALGIASMVVARGDNGIASCDQKTWASVNQMIAQN